MARTPPPYVWRDGSICFELESLDADVLQEARARERGEIESSWKGGLDRDKVREVEPLTRSLKLNSSPSKVTRHMREEKGPYRYTERYLLCYHVPHQTIKGPHGYPSIIPARSVIPDRDSVHPCSRLNRAMYVVYLRAYRYLVMLPR